MTWQDLVTLISGLIGVISLLLTFLTFAKTGKIKKAVTDNQTALINKFKFISHRQECIEKLNKIRQGLSPNPKSKREMRQVYSSDQIKHFYFEFQDVILRLSECTDHLKDKHKKKIEDCEEYIKKVVAPGHIFDEEDCNILQSHISGVLNILDKEDYLL
ncbi:MAG: hypothetical protein NC299_12880 [Lachnospiraceae bacterium]|nr:hypothetical protein [Ruminococcus sp.]MCM1276232.1 hypothetical protein [Lachnospiraceae bacterium]